MITVDLITGFLGSGKTTFLKKYVRFLMDRGENVCILENDYGAVNIDTMLLGELVKSGCGIETVAGACDKDCHMRRFKTKLIAMGMSGYSRVVIEPSGIFDVDEFFDTLRESPLDKWYQIGSVITIVDPTLHESLSDESRFLLASQAAVAGQIVFSFCSIASKEDISRSLNEINSAMKQIKCSRNALEYYTAIPWDDLTPDQLYSISSSGSYPADFVKLHFESGGFESIYFMNKEFTPDALKNAAESVLNSSLCGNVFRIKGFTKSGGEWYEINASHSAVYFGTIPEGQNVVIVIGENLNKYEIQRIFDTKELNCS